MAEKEVEKKTIIEGKETDRKKDIQTDKQIDVDVEIDAEANIVEGKERKANTEEENAFGDKKRKSGEI